MAEHWRLVMCSFWLASAAVITRFFRESTISRRHLVASLGWGMFVAFLALANVASGTCVNFGVTNEGQDDELLNERAHLLTAVTAKDQPFALELVLASIPPANDGNQEIATRTVPSIFLSSTYFNAVGVCGGHLIAIMYPDKLVAIDLTTGSVRQIATSTDAMIAGDHLFFIAVTGMPAEDNKQFFVLNSMDLSTGVISEVCRLSAALSARQLFKHSFSMSVSPEGSRIAVTEMMPKPGQLSSSVDCRIVVVDIRSGRVSKSGPDFTTVPNVFHGGFGTPPLPPKIGWADNESILVVSQKMPNTGGFGILPFEFQLSRYWPVSKSTEHICLLPESFGRISRNDDGEAVIHLRGPYRIDFQKKELVEQEYRIGDYKLQGSGRLLSLHFRDDVLAKETEESRVLASADRRRIAWLPPSSRQGMFINEPHELKMHDRIHGVRSVLTAKFPHSSFQNRMSFGIWLADKDFVPTGAFDKLKPVDNLRPVGKMPQKRRIDVRPKAADSVNVTMTTDKTEYFLHEPIRLKISVKNLSEEPIRFESRLLLQGAGPLSDLNLKSAGSKRQIQIFERGLNEPESKFVEIPPGQSKDFARIVESNVLGDHEVHLRLDQYSSWSGYVKAATDFKVQKGGAQQDLIQKKFDRMLASCKKEFSHAPLSVRTNRFDQLGTDGAALLVDYLQNSKDDAFCERLRRGLTRIADESSLPYVKQLLQTELKDGGETVVNTLWGVYRRGNYQERPIPESIKLLIEAGRHPNVDVRRKAIRLMCKTVNETVDKFMQEATEDSDPFSAQTAGRYVAVREGLSLKDWIEGASQKLTPSSLAAARSIVSELERTWKLTNGELPKGTFDEIVDDPKKVAEYSATLKHWVAWCQTHERSIANFFEKDREKSVQWNGRSINRYASGTESPIVLRPRSTYLID